MLVPLDIGLTPTESRTAIAGMLGFLQGFEVQVRMARDAAHEARSIAEQQATKVGVTGHKASNDWLRLSGAVGAYTTILNALADCKAQLLRELQRYLIRDDG